ncbi:MAG: M28 family peptidase [Verrucomicrobia bacterium]|nr:M28 family peptidase [Verrucomicrobiota bacterium]
MRVRWLLTGVSLLAAAGGVLGWWIHGRTPHLGQAAYGQTAAILAHGPRPPGSEGLTAVRSHVKSELAKAGWVTQGQSFERSTPVGSLTFENLRARFPAGAADPWGMHVRVILCAHLDSKHFKDQHFLGADDAASACAAIVEIAKFLAKRKPAQAQNLELVFFDGEESLGPDITAMDGLYGSRHYANQWRTRADKPEFGILLDMIGHEHLSILLSSDTPADLRERVMAAAKAEDAQRHFGMAMGPITDDHVPLNSAGIPTVDIIGDFGRSGWWHTPADNQKIISAKSLDISIRVTLRLLAGLLEK